MELEGGCVCGATRYKLKAAPLIVNACHCRDCQRLTGSAFVVNIWIERGFMETDHDRLVSAVLTAGSGKPHEVFRCRGCSTPIYSRYHAAPVDTVFVRAATLDEPAAVTPDAHIYTRSKLPWADLPAGVPAFEGIYKFGEVLSAESRERLRRNSTGGG